MNPSRELRLPPSAADDFLTVGSNDDVLPLATARTHKIDLAFKTVLPASTTRIPIPVASGVMRLRKVACDSTPSKKSLLCTSLSRKQRS